MVYVILLITISTTLSYLIFKFIYRIIFKSQKKISKFLVFLGSIGLIIFYYTPYSFYLEPSYWQFKNMCKLNELPNDEYKYNKILKYFDLSLDTLDWEELNKNKVKYKMYIGGIERSRYYLDAYLYSNEKISTKDNIRSAVTHGEWRTRRYVLSGGIDIGFDWLDESIYCHIISTPNYEPQERKNNDK